MTESENFGILRDRELRPIQPEVPVLRPGEAYAFLFQTEQTPQGLGAYVKQRLIDVIVSHRTFLAFSAIHLTLYDLVDTAISPKNVYAVAFERGTEPWSLVTDDLLRLTYPQSVELTNPDKVTNLAGELKKSNIITSGVFAGSLLLSTVGSKLDGNFKGSIAIGIVDQSTNKPLGVVFCPEGMLDYKFVDYKNHTTRKRIPKLSAVPQEAVRVGVQI